ncbi:MAG: T9SS type A sorting domain-containing protein [Salibacteraceae bacterium]
MKSINLIPFVICLFLSSTILTQTIYPDGKGEPESDRVMFIENDGQLRSEVQWQADVIQFYTLGAPGNMFFTTSNFFVSARKRSESQSEPDTIHRLDFSYTNGASEVNPRLLSPTGADIRFYNEFGTYANLSSGKRIVYEDLYDDIHVHFYTNEFGPKSAIVFENGADPSNFEMTIDGYDDITEVLNYIVIHKADYSYVIPEGLAYEVDGSGNVTQLSWRPKYMHNGNGKLQFSDLGSWDTDKTLIFQFGASGSRDDDPEYVNWCTLVGGGDGETKILDLESDDSGNLYAGGYTTSTDFPASNTAIQEEIEGMTDFIFLKFNPNHELVWATYIGGSQSDDAGREPFRFGLKSNDNLMIATHTWSLDFPLLDIGGNAYFSSVNDCEGEEPTSCLNGVIIEISSSGTLVYSTFFGNFGSTERLRSIVLHSDDSYYVVGSGNYPFENPSGAFFSPIGGGHIARFNDSYELVWSTSFGGPGTHVYDCTLDQNGKLLITGFTSNHSNFPTLSMTGAYNEPVSDGGFWEGFIAQFDTDHSQEWTTFIGGNKGDKFWDIDVSTSNNIIISGHTTSDADLPLTASGNAFFQNTYGGTGNIALNQGDGVFARFDSNRDLVHCSYFGDDSSDELRDMTFHHSHLLATGVSGSANGLPFPTTNPSMMYVESTHQDGNDVHTDGFVMALDENYDLYWNSFVGSYGGTLEFGEDEMFAVQIDGLNKMYVSGAMISQQGLPLQDPGGNAWFQSTSNAYPEGFICLFDLTDSPLIVDETNDNPMSVFPNPFIKSLHVVNAKERMYHITIYDLQGRVIMKDYTDPVSLQLDHIQSGTYILELQSKSNGKTFKIVKQ